MCKDCHDDCDDCQPCDDCRPSVPNIPENNCEPTEATPINLAPGPDETPCETDWRNDIPGYPHGWPGLPGSGSNPGSGGNPGNGGGVTTPGNGGTTPGGGGTNPGGGGTTPGGGGTTPPPPTPFLSTPTTKTVTRSNCGPGKVGGTYEAKLPAGAFQSLLSQADANNKARTWLDQIAQAEADKYGLCQDNTQNVTLIREVSWDGETGCTTGSNFAGVGWGWESGVVDAACPVRPPSIRQVAFDEVEGCPAPTARLYGVEFIGNNCN